MTRKELEATSGWVATFERTRPNVRERFDCLMSNVVGGYYWHTPDYKGAFPWGATRTFCPDITRDFLAHGLLKLVAGEYPAILRPKE